MPDQALRTPVALIIFNRPETTAQVFAAIAAARPPLLLIVADGPRAGHASDTERCAQARALVQRIDWPCELRTNFSAINLGCRRRVSSGISWVFEQVEEAIILEDDCLPHADFFPYCQQLLARYRHDPRVGIISGANFQFGQTVGAGSYYFSKYAHVWGWASWRRAWRHYDVQCRAWPQWLAAGALKPMTAPCEREYWNYMFHRVHQGEIDTWDYQWLLACWQHSMLAAIPQANLISNLGFGPDARSTRGDSVFARMPLCPLPLPWREPPEVAADRSADLRVAQSMFKLSWARRLKYRWRRLTR